MISIVENTLRDGSYTVDFQMSTDNTKDVVEGFDKIGFDIIEVGHGLGLGAYNNPKTGLAPHTDTEYIQAAKEVSQKARISAFFIPGIGTKEDIKLAHSNGLDVIRIGVNVNEYKKCREYAEYAKELGLTVGVNLMKSYAVKWYQFSKIVHDINEWNVSDVIYLVDSAGCMTPFEVDQYLYISSENTSTPLGFHGHNNLSLAAINTIQAVKSGANYIDTCVRGMGRSAGNAQTEIVIILLQKLGFYKHISIYDLYDFANKIVVPMMNQSQGMTDEEIHIGYSKFHTSYLPLVNNSVNEFKTDRKKLIKAVSDINCLNPTQDLFNKIANEL